MSDNGDKKKTKAPPKPRGKQVANVPQATPEQAKALMDANAELRATTLIDMLGREHPPIPKDYVFRLRDRQFVENATFAAFDLIGGVPSFVMWASENPTEFYKLFSRFAPEPKAGQQQATQIVIQTSLPESPLSNIVVTEDGTVRNATFRKDEDDSDDEDDE